jgi:hypothetical protein
MGPISTPHWAAVSGNTFFASGGDSSETTDFDLYRMVDLTALSHTEPLLPYAIPTKMGTFSTAQWRGFLGGPNLQWLASDLAMIGVDQANVGVVRIPMSDANTVHEMRIAPSVTLTDELLCEVGTFDEQISACIATGRLVVVVHLAMVDGCVEWVIRVIDYLSPV